MTEPIKPRPRRWTLSLRSLMLLILVIGGILGWKARRASIQRKAVAAIESAGGSVQYDYQQGSVVGSQTPGAKPWAPAWLRRPIGDEYFQEVSKVTFRRNGVGDVTSSPDPTIFATLATLDRVESVRTNRFPVNDSDFTRLMAMPRLREVCLLDIEDVTEAGLDSLKLSPTIETLQLRFKPGKTIARALLEAIARQPRLKNLELLSIDLTDPKSMEPLAKLTRLESLKLTTSPEDDLCLESIRGLTELRIIDLGRTQLTDARIDCLAKLTKLEFLVMDGSKLTDAGFRRLAAISSLIGMEFDPLPGLTNAGLASLGRGKIRSFFNLDLIGSKITDAGLEHLKGLKLASLSVSGDGVTDLGLAKLVAANQFRDLDLSKTRVTGASVLANQTKLRWLALDGSTARRLEVRRRRGGDPVDPPQARNPLAQPDPVHRRRPGLAPASAFAPLSRSSRGEELDPGGHRRVPKSQARRKGRRRRA